MSAVKLCSGRWNEDTTWEFFLAEELPPLELFTGASCVGIMEPGGKIVLSHTHQGWSCPGGHQEDGETLEQTMQREALEEGGFRVERYRLLGFRKVTNTRQLFARQTGKPYPFPTSYIAWYVAKSSLPLVPTTGDDGEVFEARLFTLEGMRAMHLADQQLIEAGVSLRHTF